MTDYQILPWIGIEGMRTNTPSPPRLLTPAVVAAYFAVNPKTVTRWAKAGLIPCIKTPGGHRRYPESDVLRLLGLQQPDPIMSVER